MYRLLLLLFCLPAVLPASESTPLKGAGCTADGWCYDSRFPHGFHPKAGFEGRVFVGDDGLILRHVENGWVRDEAPVKAALRGVWAASPQDIHARATHHLLHFDGSEWRDVTPPEASDAMWEALGGGSGGVYASGFFGRLARYEQGAWHLIDSGVKTALNAISVLAADTAWFVGRDGVVLAYEDGKISCHDTGGGEWLSAVLARAPDDVWVGARGGLLLHYDGAGWQRFEHSVQGEIRFILPDGGDGLILGGLKGDIVRFRKDRRESLGFPNQGDGDLRGLWRDQRQRLVALSGGQTLVHDGDAWHADAPILTDVIAFDDGSLAACGFNGALERHADGQWRGQEGGAARMFTSLWGAGPDSLYLVDARNGGIVHVRDDLFQPIPASGDKHLASIWGSGENDIFAVGEKGLIVHFDGKRWQTQVSGIGKHLYRVDGSGPNDVWAVGRRGSLLHYDGTAWQAVKSPHRYSWRLLDVVAPDDVWVGDSDSLMHYDGSEWRDVEIEGLGFDVSLHDLTGLPNGTLIAVGKISQGPDPAATEGVVLVRTNGKWRVMRGLQGARLNAVAIAAGGALYAVGGDDSHAHLPAKQAAALLGERMVSGGAGDDTAPFANNDAETTEPIAGEAAEALPDDVTGLDRQAAQAIASGDLSAALKRLKQAQQARPDPRRADRMRRIQMLLELRGGK